MLNRICRTVSLGLVALSLIAGTASSDDQNKSWATKMFAEPKFDFEIGRAHV